MALVSSRLYRHSRKSSGARNSHGTIVSKGVSVRSSLPCIIDIGVRIELTIKSGSHQSLQKQDTEKKYMLIFLCSEKFPSFNLKAVDI